MLGDSGSGTLNFSNASSQSNVPWSDMTLADGPGGAPQLYYTPPMPRDRGILWGPNRNLDFWKASKAGAIGPEELRAVSLLSSYSDEARLSYYLHSGLFPALGNVTKRIYMVRRFHTVIELDDGVPSASWCILTTNRQHAPETDHVITMKNLVEGEELSFRSVANRFEPNTDPFIGQVPLRNHVTNPYVNGPVGIPKVHRESENGKIFMEQHGWRQAALFRHWLRHEAVLDLARRRLPNAQQQEASRPKHHFISPYESMLRRIRDHLAASYGIEVPKEESEALLPPPDMSVAIPVVHSDGTPLS